jgi:uncharacterized repeat protein (TIGR01451 family)
MSADAMRQIGSTADAPHARAALLRSASRSAFVRSLMLLFLVCVFAAGARAGITVTPTTWNVVGLDSNNVNAGPDTFQVGARTCNTGATAVTNLAANFVWDTSNANINLSGASTLNSQSLAAGACVDFYFQIVVTRTSAAYNTSRRYHITVSGTGASSASTPTPREIYVEKLISQGRNTVDSITGPTTVNVGQTYQYTINSSTAPGGYDQFEAFLNLSNVVFQVQSISTTYTSPAGGTNDKFYADACGWQPDPTLANYRSCVGPVNYAGGKAGGTVSTTYTVKILGGSGTSTTAGSLILDFSGSSYHYASGSGITVSVQPPQVTLSKIANPTTAVTGSNVAYTLRLTNTGSSAYTITDFVDTIPTTPATPAYVTNTSAFGGAAIGNPAVSGATLTWSGSFTVPASATRDLTYTLTMPATAGSYINSAVAHIDYVQIDTTATPSDNSPASATVAVVLPPSIGLCKTFPGQTCSPAPTLAAQQPGADITYVIIFTNSGGSAAQGLTITDAVPANTDFKVGSVVNNLGTTGLTVSVQYSNNGGTTYAYTPVSAGGSAPAGYDRNVTHVRWTFTGNLSQVSPNNTGDVRFTARIR